MFWSITFISIDWTFALTPPELGIVNVPQTDNGNVGQISNNGFNWMLPCKFSSECNKHKSSI